MTKKTKAIRTIAAVTAAALLGGGIYLLVKSTIVLTSHRRTEFPKIQKRSLQHRYGSFPTSIVTPWPGCISPVQISITRSCSRKIMNITLTGRRTEAISMQARCLWTTAVQVIFRTSTALFMVTIWAMERCLQIFRITKTRNISWNTATAG